MAYTVVRCFCSCLFLCSLFVLKVSVTKIRKKEKPQRTRLLRNRNAFIKTLFAEASR